MKSKAARAIADVSSGTILATVDIAVPPERVFHALVASSEVLRWWGSDEVYRTTKWTFDDRVGGHWRADGVGADGVAFHVEGDVLELDPPRRLVQTWRPSWDEGEATTLTYRLEPIEGGTKLTLRHDGFGTREAACRDHALGWELVLGWLIAHVAPAPADSYFFMRLLAPRPTFAFDMNADEAAVMQAHSGYWREQLAAGMVVAFGPVADPKGPWGLGIVRAPDEAAVRAFQERDPALQSGLGFTYELMPMLAAVH